MSPKNASASATPMKKVSFPDAIAGINLGIKKAVTKRGTRNQSFRSNRAAPLTSTAAREIFKAMSEVADDDENVFEGSHVH